MTRKRPPDPTDEITASPTDEVIGSSTAAVNTAPMAGDDAGPVETDLDDPVGYGKPPKHTRFKPGQSGNPRGRPKGARNIETVFRDELFGTISVMENGRRTKMSRIQALLRRLMEKGFAGDVRSAVKLLELALRLSPGQAGPLLAEVSGEDFDLLDMLSRRALASATGDGNA